MPHSGSFKKTPTKKEARFLRRGHEAQQRNMDSEKATPASYEIPADAEGMGAVQDEDRAFIFGFRPHRKVFSTLGFLVVPEDDTNLRACAKALCDTLYMQAVIKVKTLLPEDILPQLSESERQAPNVERNLAIVLTAARQAVCDYASKLER